MTPADRLARAVERYMGRTTDHKAFASMRKALAAYRAAPVRCQHQDSQGRHDCDEPPVLCEMHGGHDACAVDLMNAQRKKECGGGG